MRKIILTTMLTLATMSVNAQKSFQIQFSNDGEAILHAFLPSSEKSTGRAIICCPGGGYSHVCMDYEGTDWAPYYNDMGIAYFVLKYRMPKGDRSIPIGDATKAITTVRDSATVWNINPQDIGIMGFSAGGHLASTIATHASPEARPNFQILFYPVISMDKGKGHHGSSANFLGDAIDDENLIAEYSNYNKIEEGVTPPAILFMASDDTAVPVLTNGIPYYISLRQHNVCASMHIYPKGGHGWRPERFPFYKNMLSTLKDWLLSF